MYNDVCIQPLGQGGIDLSSDGPLALIWGPVIPIIISANADVVMEKVEGIKSCQWKDHPEKGNCLLVEREEDEYWGRDFSLAVCNAIAEVTGEPLGVVLYGADGLPRVQFDTNGHPTSF